MKNSKNLRNVWWLLALTFMLGSCESLEEWDSSQEEQVQQDDRLLTIFRAVAPMGESGVSRTTLVDGEKVYWTSGDAIAVFTNFAAEQTERYKFTSDIPEEQRVYTTSFTGYVDETYEHVYTAFYPFEQFKGYGWYNEESDICFVIPPLQTAIAGSFASHLNPAWAQTDVLGGEFYFQNIGALVKITLTDVAPELQSITLTDKAGNKISGEMVLNLSDPHAPVLSEYQDGISVSSIKMEGNFESGKDYYFVVAPTEGIFSEGFSLFFQKVDGTVFEKKGKAGVIMNLQASQIADLGEISLRNVEFAEVITDLNFIAAVENATGIDWTKNQDGTVPITTDNMAKMSAISFLDVSNAGIQSLNGIRYFTELVELKCNRNQLLELDVSGLKNLEVLECSDNFIYELNVSELSSLRELFCENNNLSALDVSGLLNLQTLSCFSNNLFDLKLGELTKLKYLVCSDNNLTTLDVSSLDNLSELNCSINDLSVLDVSKLVNLEFLICNNNKLSELDVVNLFKLRSLTCNDNQLSELDVSTLGNLTALVCSSNFLERLDVGNLTKLESLSCNYNRIVELDVSGLTALDKLYCWDNQIRVLNVSGATGLIDLQCFNNQIEELDVDDLVDLEGLNCGQNQISVLNLSKLSQLNSLFCGGNLLVEIDLSNQRKLGQLSCIPQKNLTVDSKLSLILNETLRDWWNNLSSYDQNRCHVTWVE